MTSTTAGHGRIIVELHGEDAVFAELSSTYPLKLLSPRVRRRGFATVYMISYGGGLVSGDEVVLSGQVRRGTSLVLLSQGSTKVFKLRPGHRAATAAASSGLPTTQQTLEFTVETGSALFLLPDPVTCFEAASYNQIQRFRLEAGASLAVLDWVTSGRKSRGEEWLFSRYFSVNEIEVGGKCVAKDVLLLEGDYRERVQAYSCYATLFLVGPAMGEVVGKLREEYGRITVFRTSKPEKFLWSLSELGSDGVVVRLAGEREEIQTWVDALKIV